MALENHYYSGRRLISQRKAAQIVPRLSEETFADFVETYSVESYDVGKACANILAQMIKWRSEGLSDDVVKFNFKRYEAGRKLKISPRRRLNAEATSCTSQVKK